MVRTYSTVKGQKLVVKCVNEFTVEQAGLIMTIQGSSKHYNIDVEKDGIELKGEDLQVFSGLAIYGETGDYLEV